MSLSKIVNKVFTSNWDGTQYREIFKYKDNRFRIVTGLRNGRAQDCIDILGPNGWKFLLGKNDIGTQTMSKDISYVSNEVSRKEYATQLARRLKIAVIDIFND